MRLPFDRHIEQGGEIELEQLSRRMRDSLLGLAATVAEDFPRRSAATDPVRPQLAESPEPGPARPDLASLGPPPAAGVPGSVPTPEGSPGSSVSS